LLLPPSLPVILYAISAQTPIDQLFIGALLPGLLLTVAVAGWGAIGGVTAGVERAPFQWREAIQAVRGAIWDLLLPVIVLVNFFGGFTTLVEAAALSVVYAAVVECLVHRNLTVSRDLPRIGLQSVTLVGGFLIILGMALGFTNYLISAEIPMKALAWVQLHIESKLAFLLALNILLIVIGALMDIYSAILIVVPLIQPIAAAYEIDPIHLGVIFLANMELGYLMPPMGENLFLSSYRFNQPLSRIYRSTLPFLVVLLAIVLLITYVPALTLFPLQWVK
jgi:tripartite ATP-independent transporter DctM subunit